MCRMAAALRKQENVSLLSFHFLGGTVGHCATHSALAQGNKCLVFVLTHQVAAGQLGSW